MNIDTTQYEGAHGKKPRGLGRWSFVFGRNGAWTTGVAPGPMNYTEAKKWAKQEAKSIGADQIIVES